MALTGCTGSGKTYTGLAVGCEIARQAGSRLAVIDTEHGKSQLYTGTGFDFDFDVLSLTNDQSPQAYVSAIKSAEAAGYKVILIDSLSHAWMGKGGELEQADKRAAKGGNSFTAWRFVTPEHGKLVDAILGSSAHMIVTFRVKMGYEVSNTNGKATPEKVGLQVVMKDGIEYEFDLIGELALKTHCMEMTKSRAYTLADRFIDKPGREFAEIVWTWLRDGSEAAPAQVLAQAEHPQEPAAPEESQKRLAPETPADALTEAVVRDVLKTWMGARNRTPQEVVDRFLRPHGARTVGECPFAWPQIVAAVEAEMRGGA